MSNELAKNMNVLVATEDTTGPTGQGTYYEGVRSGLKVRVVQVMQHVCGYVLLPEGHPWLTAEDDWDIDSTVHGGITYRKGGWVGFDTAHGWDIWPDLQTGPIPEWKLMRGEMDNFIYWTAPMFMIELEKLAKEAADAVRELEAGTDAS